MLGGLFFTTKDIAEVMQQAENERPAVFYDTSSYCEHGRYFSPFTFHERPIPVPGMEGVVSHSVEGIWQGLKIIDGQCDFSLFEMKRPGKRRFTPYPETRFRHGSGTIGLVEARHKIYVPSYTYMLNNLAPAEIVSSILSNTLKGIDQYFYDVDENPDITNTEKSYAHSSLLVDLLEEKLARLLSSDNQPPKRP